MTPRFAISVLSFLLLTGFARDASAGPIELENDVSVSWADNPCGDFGVVCDPIFVDGAPRFVPDAKEVGELLMVSVDFFRGANMFPAGSLLFAGKGDNTLYLNFGDTALNEILVPGPEPGTTMPLRLTYPFQPNCVSPSNCSGPLNNVVLNVAQFDGFNLLPQGDLFFTVSFHPQLLISDRTPGDPDYAVRITFEGPGVVVPEPSSLLLLLSGLASVWFGARWRRPDRAIR
jgi:hypothetical protein